MEDIARRIACVCFVRATARARLLIDRCSFQFSKFASRLQIL